MMTAGHEDDGRTSVAGGHHDLSKLLRRERKSRLRSILTAATAILVLGGALAGWRLFAAGGGEPEERFVTAKVARGDLSNTITATGKVEALITVEVGAEVSGAIAAVHVDFDDPVTRGQLLAELDAQQYEAAVGEAEARLRAARAGVTEARARANEAERESRRAADLGERGLTSAREVDAARDASIRAAAALTSARASADLAAASLEAARTRLIRTRIHSPIDGSVLSRRVDVGQTVNAGMQTPVLFILAEDLRRMRISALVDEADIGAVRAGQPAGFRVDAYPDHEFRSEVVAVRNQPTVEQSVVSYETLLTVDNERLMLKPGMTATAEIITESHEGVLLVPNAALRFTMGGGQGSQVRRGPPGVPILGKLGADSRKKPGSGGGAREAAKALGEVGPGQGVVWVLDGDDPRPIKVDRLATDGSNTAVAGEGLAEGMVVITDRAVEATRR